LIIGPRVAALCPEMQHTSIAVVCSHEVRFDFEGPLDLFDCSAVVLFLKKKKTPIIACHRTPGSHPRDLPINLYGTVVVALFTQATFRHQKRDIDVSGHKLPVELVYRSPIE